MKTLEEIKAFIDNLQYVDTERMDEAERSGNEIGFLVSNAKRERSASILSFIRGELDPA